MVNYFIFYNLRDICNAMSDKALPHRGFRTGPYFIFIFIYFARYAGAEQMIFKIRIGACPMRKGFPY